LQRSSRLDDLNLIFLKFRFWVYSRYLRARVPEFMNFWSPVVHQHHHDSPASLSHLLGEKIPGYEFDHISEIRRFALHKLQRVASRNLTLHPFRPILRGSKEGEEESSGWTRLKRSALYILIDDPSQILKRFNETTEGRCLSVAAAMRRPIPASLAASLLAVLDAKRAGNRPGGQMAEHGEHQSPGELMKLARLDGLQPLGEQLRPADVLRAGCGHGGLCRLQGCGINGVCGSLKLFGTIGHIFGIILASIGLTSVQRAQDSDWLNGPLDLEQFRDLPSPIKFSIF